MFRILVSLFALVSTTLPAFAQCSGPNRFAALPAETRAALIARARQVPFAEGLLWRVEKDGVASTVLGTFHFAHDSHAATLDRLAGLEPRPEQVFLEITEADGKAFQNTIVTAPERMLITSGPSLMDRLGPEAWERLKPRLAAIGLPGFIAAKYQPWFLGMTLALPPCAIAAQRAGALGLDRRIEERARAENLPVRSLDRIDGLLALLASDPLDEQVDTLRWSLMLDIDTSQSDDIGTLIALYRQERPQLIWDYAKHRTDSMIPDTADARRMAGYLAEVERDLLVARNTAWIGILAPELAQTPSLVAVGALHLPGETGVLALLQGHGFTVTRLPLRAD